MLQCNLLGVLSSTVWLIHYRIDENFVIKVADFGLSEDIYARHYFRQGAEEEGGSLVQLPVRWMAIESLNDMASSLWKLMWYVYFEEYNIIL